MEAVSACKLEDSDLAPFSDDNMERALTDHLPEVPPLERLSITNEPIPSSPCSEAYEVPSDERGTEVWGLEKQGGI